MSSKEIHHNGNGESGALRASIAEGFVRIQIIPMNDKPYVDISLRELIAFVNTIKVQIQTGELK